MHINRKAMISRRTALAVAAGAMLLTACDTDQFLRARDPDNTPPGTLTGPLSLPAYLSSAIGDFGVAFDGNANNPDGNEYEGLVNMGGLFTDELQNSETFPTRIEVDRRRINVRNTTMRDIYFNIQGARVSALRAAEAFAAFGPDDPGRSEVESLQGYSILLMAEDYCSGVPLSEVDSVTSLVEPGEPLTTPQLLQVASDTFTAALNLANAAQDDDRKWLAEVGLARTLLSLGRTNLPQAAALVSDVPTDWKYLMTHSKNSQHQWNGIYEFIFLEGRFVVGDNEGINGLPFRDGDPRVPLTTAGATFTRVPGGFVGPARYDSQDSSTVIASGVEARLIEAEAALQANDVTTFLAKLNDLRSTVPGLDPLTDPGDQEGRVRLLFSERAFWLYMTGHRLGDLRRMSKPEPVGYGFDPESVFPTGDWYRGGTYGTDVNFPLPVQEQNNPNLPQDGVNTCLDRNP